MCLACAPTLAWALYLGFGLQLWSNLRGPGRAASGVCIKEESGFPGKKHNLSDF